MYSDFIWIQCSLEVFHRKIPVWPPLLMFATKSNCRFLFPPDHGWDVAVLKIDGWYIFISSSSAYLDSSNTGSGFWGLIKWELCPIDWKLPENWISYLYIIYLWYMTLKCNVIIHTNKAIEYLETHLLVSKHQAPQSRGIELIVIMKGLLYFVIDVYELLSFPLLLQSLPSGFVD